MEPNRAVFLSSSFDEKILRLYQNVLHFAPALASSTSPTFEKSGDKTPVHLCHHRVGSAITIATKPSVRTAALAVSRSSRAMPMRRRSTCECE